MRREPQALGHFLRGVERGLAPGQGREEKAGVEAHRVMFRRDAMEKISEAANVAVEPFRLQKTGKIQFASLQAFSFFRQSTGWVILGR